MEHRREIRFLLNDATVVLDAVAAEDTLLEFLRLTRRLTGTKEGCAEGDCGACTVLVGRIAAGELVYEPVNACIRLLPSLDGCHVVTVEHLADAVGGLHPVQDAMVADHGSQCGFCTPGVVMALAALRVTTPAPSEDEIETALQGNLCRCTGYAPIVRAALAACHEDRRKDSLVSGRAAALARLRALRDGRRAEVGRDDSHAILPADVDDLAAVLAAHPDATVVAGATDVGLWITKGMRRISPAVFIGHLDGLRQVETEAGGLRIGAGATYTEAEGPLCSSFPHLRDYLSRIAGWQVRNMGTIGGNIANGSPIGDMPPVLIALGAELTLRQGDKRRALPLEDYFLDYGKQDRAPGEFVESVFVPKPTPGAVHAAYKVSKRRDEDISSVAAAFNVTLQDGKISAARIAFGGMAATPRRATAAEAALIGASWVEDSLIAAAAELPADFTPITDWRASSTYRMTVAQNLFRRFWLEHAEGADTVRLHRAAEGVE
ncbi:Xanthine dehydrogenase, iron-sulfur cluster and FAD-binding subunit A [Rhodovulum sp. P5]|uniref:xanthine dehydrogenase small subunit n=1 Tax=Rhodovulum sp. P5 TaxID=1564506 RepID=UPI0009C1EFDF|nr:xanthine dehydrogenase small subunit [Rhodovulum sp. P5]ARE41556.1 Xanthine dehydrogenase, iron-sulfur cluster and FAD-binding subunit A [Rhodovulum sp. P5]